MKLQRIKKEKEKRGVIHKRRQQDFANFGMLPPPLSAGGRIEVTSTPAVRIEPPPRTFDVCLQIETYRKRMTGNERERERERQR